MWGRWELKLEGRDTRRMVVLWSWWRLVVVGWGRWRLVFVQRRWGGFVFVRWRFMLV